MNKRLTIVAPGKEMMEQVIALEEAYLSEEWDIPGWEEDDEDEEEA